MVEQLLAGSAIGSLVVTFWGQIKAFLQRLRSLVFVNASIESALDTGMADYCWQKLRRIRLGGDYSFQGIIRFRRENKKNVLTVYEDLDSVGVLFWYGWVPILLWRTGGTDGGQNTPSTVGKVMISYIRGTLNIDKLMMEAAAHYDLRNEQGFKLVRYSINPRIGTFGNNASDRNNKRGREVIDGRANNRIWGKRLVGMSENDLDDGMNDIQMSNILAYPANIMNAMDDARKWMANKDWYVRKGIAWKRSWLLYGPPGTGKTSLVKMLGETLDMPVHVFALSTFRNSEFQEAWLDLRYYSPVIALIEDIDTVFEGRKNIIPGMDEGRLTFDTLLNSLDGIQSTEGIFTIVTTNKVELLDEALGKPNAKGFSTRPGRIDLAIELKTMDRACRMTVARRILSEWPDMISQVVNEGEGDSPAQFQYRCAQLALTKFWNIEHPGIAAS